MDDDFKAKAKALGELFSQLDATQDEVVELCLLGIASVGDAVQRKSGVVGNAELFTHCTASLYNHLLVEKAPSEEELH